MYGQIIGKPIFNRPNRDGNKSLSRAFSLDRRSRSKFVCWIFVLYSTMFYPKRKRHHLYAAVLQHMQICTAYRSISRRHANRRKPSKMSIY